MVTDLGTLGGKSSGAYAANDKGEIVGFSDTKAGLAHAFLWSKGRMHDLGVSPAGFNFNGAVAINGRGQILGVSSKYVPIGNTEGTARSRVWFWENGRVQTIVNVGMEGLGTLAMNDRGQVIGTYTTRNGSFHQGFVWQDGKMTKLVFGPTAVNNRGQVVGGSTDAMLWERGRTRDLGSLGQPGTGSKATALNDRGQIVGGSGDYPYSGHAFLWQKGKMTDLGTLGGKSSTATAVNERGQIVGTSTFSQSTLYHAFLWQKGHMTDLGALQTSAARYSSATMINDLGQIIGLSSVGRTDLAVVWAKGRMTALPTLGGEGAEAAAINNQGQIVGQASVKTGDASHAVLWQRLR
jgi:probable HAF family extracellular repeat protein